MDRTARPGRSTSTDAHPTTPAPTRRTRDRKVRRRALVAGALAATVLAAPALAQAAAPVHVGPASVLTPGSAQQVMPYAPLSDWLRPTPTPPPAPAPAPTTPPAPAPAPPAAASRNPGLWPFSADSPWNMPVGSGVQLEAEGGAMTRNLRAATMGGHKVQAWMNADTYSHPVLFAKASDPRVFVDQKYDQDEWVHIPAGAQPAKGMDRHLHVVQPDGRTIVEMWDVTPGGTGTWKAGRLEVVDLYGNGIGPDNGTRAYGGSAIGGLIRTWEVDPRHPDYTDGVIRHAIALALPGGMLKYTGGNSGYDANGYGTARGYVWPATEQDYNSPGTYSGQIPMGSMVVIPKNVNVDALGLNPQVRAIAKALQDYGGYVTDRTGGSTFSLYAENTVPSSYIDAVNGPSWSGSQLEKLRQHLRVVTNNGPGSVGGGGAPTAPLAPRI